MKFNSLLSNSKILFWILGIGIGLFIGGLQSTSRSCMARLSKKNDQSRMFGIYGLSGKITAFLGPSFVALLTTTFNNQKAGFISIIIFFILGYLIIRNLKLPNYSNSKWPKIWSTIVLIDKSTVSSLWLV